MVDVKKIEAHLPAPASFPRISEINQPQSFKRGGEQKL